MKSIITFSHTTAFIPNVTKKQLNNQYNQLNDSKCLIKLFLNHITRKTRRIIA